MGATWWRGRALLAAQPRGDGRTVLLLPGLGNAHGSMAVMRRYLDRVGYRAEHWGLGRNWGARTAGREAEVLIARLEGLVSENGPVTLVGVSLGGLVAQPLPVPSVAIWSRSDGLVNGLICRDEQGASVEVRSGHLWVQHRPEVLAAVARALAPG